MNARSKLFSSATLPSFRWLGSAAVVVAGLGLAAASGAAADSYPSRPIKIISPFSAGSPPDAFGRLIAQQLSTSLGQSVVVENRPGAGTTLGTKAGATADPDGYTLVQVNAALTYAPVLYPNLGYDPVRSFVPVGLLASWTHVLTAHPSVPADTLVELIAYAKANPFQCGRTHAVDDPRRQGQGLRLYQRGA
jgi:tripartite-type tricarboxylate transporter receptor subunit TctC